MDLKKKDPPDWMTTGIKNMNETTREPINEILYIGNARKRTQRVRPQAARVYLPNGISPTLGARSGGNLMPMVLIEYD
jgi:hypothetical protein